ncbi:hypothetical protein RFI_37389, partial [Reticulomyxa filosa]
MNCYSQIVYVIFLKTLKKTNQHVCEITFLEKVMNLNEIEQGDCFVLKKSVSPKQSICSFSLYFVNVLFKQEMAKELAKEGAPKEKKPEKKTENPIAKLFISGTVTILFEAVGGGHYFEMVKILKQTTNDSYATITKRMIANKGIVGILDGFVPWGALQASIKGSSFGFGEAAAKRILERSASEKMTKWQRDILSGGMGGFVQGVVMSPMLLLKTRVMTDPRFRTTGGFFQTSLHSLKLGGELIRTEGGLMSLTK